jgi:integrase
MAGRRMNNEGSVYQRASDSRWIGAVTLGYDERGKLRRKTVSGKTKAEALAKLKVLQRTTDDGLPPPDDRMTVSQLIDRWKSDVLHHQVAQTAADNYAAIAEHHIIPTLGRKRVSRLTPADVDRLMSEKIKSGLSVSTVRRVRAVLAQALRQAEVWGIVNRNVAAMTRGPKATRQEGRTLTPKQAKQLLDSLRGSRHEALFATMLSLGLRRGEALGLKWDDVDLKKGVLVVRRQLRRETRTAGADGEPISELVLVDVKTARSRRSINLPKPLVSLLKAHQRRQKQDTAIAGELWQDSGHMFTTVLGGPLDPRNVYRDFQAATQAAGLGKWHPHELRHSAASLMLAQGVPIDVVAQVLGHSSIRMTADVYGHILEPQRQAAAKAMAGALWR